LTFRRQQITEDGLTGALPIPACRKLEMARPWLIIFGNLPFSVSHPPELLGWEEIKHSDTFVPIAKAISQDLLTPIR
jgi:hypothetical protein